MPIPPPVPNAPYVIVDDVLNLARTRVNDAIQSIGGEILTDSQPFTQVMTNAAWLKMQQYLYSLGYSRNRKRTVLTGMPIVASADPASETVLTWSWFYDGVSYWIPPNTPVLPADFISPLKIRERQSAGYQPVLVNGAFSFREMQYIGDGNCNWMKRPWNGWFDWRDDKLVMPGSLISMDLEIEYAAFLEDFQTVGEITWNNQPVPIARSLSAFANFLCYEFTKPRGDAEAASHLQDAQQDCRELLNNYDVTLKQRTNRSRRSYAGYQGYRWGGGMTGGF